MTQVAESSAERALVRLALRAEDGFEALVRLLLTMLGQRCPVIIPFIGHGPADHVRIDARVMLGGAAAKPERVPPVRDTPSRWATLRAALRRFFTVELPYARVTVHTPGEVTSVTADREGYVDVAIALPHLAPGWHELELSTRFREASTTVSTRLLVVDPDAQVALVSDVDDTVIETGLTRGLAFLRATLLTDVADRAPLPGAAALYRALVAPPGGPARPVFYLSTSPWNLHDLLLEFVTLRSFPLGPLLLTDWGPGHGHLFRIGAQQHKRSLIRQLLAEHPTLDLVLVGDSGQADPEIYATVAAESPDRVRAIYIRRTPPRKPGRMAALDALAERVSATGVPMLAVDDSAQIAEHAASIGLVDQRAVAAVRADIAAG